MLNTIMPKLWDLFNDTVIVYLSEYGVEHHYSNTIDKALKKYNLNSPAVNSTEIGETHMVFAYDGGYKQRTNQTIYVITPIEFAEKVVVLGKLPYTGW